MENIHSSRLSNRRNWLKGGLVGILATITSLGLTGCNKLVKGFDYTTEFIDSTGMSAVYYHNQRKAQKKEREARRSLNIDGYIWPEKTLKKLYDKTHFKKMDSYEEFKRYFEMNYRGDIKSSNKELDINKDKIISPREIKPLIKFCNHPNLY